MSFHPPIFRPARVRKLLALALALGLTAAAQVQAATPTDEIERAIVADNDLTVKSLLSQGISPNTLTHKGMPALYAALQLESYRAAKALIEAPDLQVDQTTAKDETALMMAAFRGQVDLAKRLIERGAAVNRKGWTPLHYAATNGHVEMIRFLLTQGAEVNALSPNESTPLMMAAMYGSDAAVNALLAAGADPARKNQLGMTAADFATKAERERLAKVLTEAAGNKR